jgi:hypothetical protein
VGTRTEEREREWTASSLRVGKTQANTRPRLKERMALPLLTATRLGVPHLINSPDVKTNWSSGYGLVHTRPCFKARAPSTQRAVAGAWAAHLANGLHQVGPPPVVTGTEFLF